MFALIHKIRHLNRKVTIVPISALVVLMASLSPLAALAASPNCDNTTSNQAAKPATSTQPAQPASCCGDGSSYNSTCDIIDLYVNPAINLLSGIFGLIAVISIILGGIQYSASEGDPQKTSQAKNRIAKTVFAVMAYFFLYVFLQFIVPGGAFNRSG